MQSKNQARVWAYLVPNNREKAASESFRSDINLRNTLLSASASTSIVGVGGCRHRRRRRRRYQSVSVWLSYLFRDRLLDWKFSYQDRCLSTCSMAGWNLRAVRLSLVVPTKCSSDKPLMSLKNQMNGFERKKKEEPWYKFTLVGMGSVPARSLDFRSSSMISGGCYKEVKHSKMSLGVIHSTRCMNSLLILKNNLLYI